MSLEMNLAKISGFLYKIIFKKRFILLFFSIAAILIATLHPFNFYLPKIFSLQTIIASFDNASSFQDLVNNILLFIPLGFGLTAFLRKTKMKPISKLLTVIFISAGLSITVEILQIFLPSRTPTPADLANNTIGGFVGMLCFYIWHSQSFLSILTSVLNSQLANSNKKITLFFLWIHTSNIFNCHTLAMDDTSNTISLKK